MFLDGIQGMDRVMTADVTGPYISLVTGPPGAMKSGFALTILSSHLTRTGEFGLYCTVEESVDSLLQGAESLNLSLPHNLQVTDFTELRRENEGMDYLKFTRRMIEHFKQQHGNRFTTFVLDSLGAIYSLTNVDEVMRKKMFSFFDFLRQQKLNVIIITERHFGNHAELEGNEGFLADAIINLGVDRRNGQIVRTVQVEKMRHVRHSMEKQAMDVGPNGPVLLGPLFD
jgi:KaiC/GvpD/RAD55 family RecA-like ATPase